MGEVHNNVVKGKSTAAW